MFQTLLKVLPTSEIICLFRREIGWTVDRIYVNEFRRWVRQKPFPHGKRILPYDFYIWLLQRVYEYSRLSQ